MRPGGHVLAAVSGGADSVALLRALHQLADRRGFNFHLHVAHVHHHWHEQADAHAAFVESLAGSLGLPYLHRNIFPDQELGNTEAAARRLRYAALRDMAQTAAGPKKTEATCGQSSSPAAVVAIAHHADDQLETLLMRLLRGSGLRGMRGLRWRRRIVRDSDVRLIRPMLAADRAMVLEYLNNLGQDWREDPTNADTARWRARLRADVLPVLRELRADAAGRAVQLAEQMEQVHEAIAAQAKQVSWQQQGDTAEASRRSLGALPEPVVYEALRQASGASGRSVAAAARAVGDGKGGLRRFAFAGGVVEVTRERVRVVREAQEP